MTVPYWIATTVKRLFAKRRHPLTKSRGFKLQLEMLEDRVVPSGNTLYVGPAADFSSTVPSSATTWTPTANYAGFTQQTGLTFDTGAASPPAGAASGFTSLQHALNQAAADYNATATPITAATWSANYATITAANSFSAGQTVVISGVTPYAYNGTFTITSATASSFKFGLAGYTASGTSFGTAGIADTVKVAPGTYTNDYDITSPVTLLGSNVYCLSSTSSPLASPPSSYNSADPEATLIQAPGAPSPGGSAYDDAFRVLASNVTIKGFFINGTATSDDGISNLNDAGHTTQVSNLLIWNNIIQNYTKATAGSFGSNGIYFDDATPGTSSPDSTKASTGNVITHNFFAHAGAAPSGNTNGAINLTDNFFATTYSNTINVNVGNANSTSVGIEIGNYNTGGIAGSTSMTLNSNSISVGQDAAGVFVYSIGGQETNQAGVFLAGNTIQAASGVAPTGLASTYGTSIKAIQAGGLVTEQDTIGTSGGQLDRGINVWNAANGSVLIYGSTVGTSTGSPAPVRGVVLETFDLSGQSGTPVFVSISGGSINGTKYGLDVEASNVNATANIGATAATSINGVGTGAGNGVGINLNGTGGGTASLTNGTITTSNTVTGTNAAIQTSGSASAAGATKTFAITGATITVTGATNVVSAIAKNNAANTVTNPGSFSIADPDGTTVNLYSYSAALAGLFTYSGGVFSWGASHIPLGTYSLVFSEVYGGTTVYQHVTFVVTQ
jgi:hypothetical protein